MYEEALVLYGLKLKDKMKLFQDDTEGIFDYKN